MTDDGPGISAKAYTQTVRESEDLERTGHDHHPHGGYTPAAFRHYIRQVALLEAFAKLNFYTALDVGCAEGYFVNIVRERFGAEVWGIDLSTIAVAKAHEKYSLMVAGGDATSLPFPTGSFDLVYSTEVIEHVLEPEAMLAEMRRVSRGTVVVTTPVSRTADEHEPDYELKAEGHVNNFDPATVKRLFGGEARLGSFRCNLTLAMIVAVGRYMPPGVRNVFYRLDHLVSQRWGAPDHSLKPLRNRDWLITVPGAGAGEGPPQWCCPVCKGMLEEHGQALRCLDCGTVYPYGSGVPDFFEHAQTA